ncbi:MAG: hypothetical protein CMG23_02345 [Candidatus Marinimicrobia bacterium]|nr:hypothetical protein [Candidatus Neomarinimicrobiota bacterium]|tara:strand:+ start:188 stop:625 length:438 start_codon:yes stop_codon:yes gene_type:complete
MDNLKYLIKVSLFLWCCISINAKTKFSDRQVATMIPKYFARDHNAPKITRTRVYGENGKKVLHLNIEVNRNRYENQMEYALSAMASVSQHAARPFDTFVLIMEQNSRQIKDEKVAAKAKCTIDHFVFKRVKSDKWMNKCIKIEEI